MKRNCPACDTAGGVNRGQRGGFQILSCPDCGSIYTASLPASASAQDYDRYYRAENLSVPDFVHRRLDEIVADFAAYRQTNRLLEIGFGAGALLQSAMRAGWRAEGVEISRTAVENAQARGIKVFHGELAQASYPTGYFDVVTASELLEHVGDPLPMVREIARVLRPGGLFWATTPHARGVSSRLLGLKWLTLSPPGHLHIFSTKGIKRLARAAGFQRVQVDTKGMNPADLWLAWHFWHKNNGTDADGVSQDESLTYMDTSYQVNEALTKSPARRAVKNIANHLLNVSRLGDSLKIFAVR